MVTNTARIKTLEIPAKYKLTRAPELVREFIHDCLYNPQTGYFQRHAHILSTDGQSLPFSTLHDESDYQQHLYHLYGKHSQAQDKTKKAFHQLWHTPSELFYPWYGQGICEYIMQTHPTPLIIYEVGPGNGTLCQSNHFPLKGTFS